jgi:hypothetical protein
MRTRLGFVLLTLLAVGPLMAEDAPKQAVSFSFGNSSSTIGYRHNFGKYAGLITAGYQKFSVTQIDSQTGTAVTGKDDGWTLGAGIRRYLARRDQVQPYVQFDLERSINFFGTTVVTGSVSGQCDKPRTTTASLTGGVEYHVTRSISIEGAAGVQQSTYADRCSGPAFSYYTSYRSVGTFRSAVTLNFYF